MYNNDDKKNDTIIDEKTILPVIKNIQNKFDFNINKDNESLNSEINKKIINDDNLFNDFGFNHIKI